MRTLKKCWMALLALVLLLNAGFILFRVYLPAKHLYETEKTALTIQNEELRRQLAEDQAYAADQERLDPAMEAIQTSRRELYDKFPVELWEEDQILYMLHLEEALGQDVVFRFAQTEDLVTLSDGAVLQGMTVTFDYKTTYEGFKNMAEAIASDDRMASVRQATVRKDVTGDTVSGQMTVMVYLLQDGRTYPPYAFGGENLGRT